jgi:hypothetical protein
MDFALAAAGGDVQAAREMYRSYFAPSQDEALALATPAGLGEVSALYDVSSGAEGSFKGQYMNYPDHLSPDGNSIGHIGIVDGGGTWVPNPERTAAMQAALAQFDSELGSILAIGPKTALSMVGYVPGAAATLYDYSQGTTSIGEASVSLIPGERVFGALGRRRPERSSRRSSIPISGFPTTYFPKPRTATPTRPTGISRRRRSLMVVGSQIMMGEAAGPADGGGRICSAPI